MEKITVIVFLKYQDRKSWCGMELLSQTGSITFAANKISQMEGKIKEPRWDEFIISEFQKGENLDNTLESLAKEDKLKYYRVVSVDPYPREQTREFVKTNSKTYTDETLVILNFLKYLTKANYSDAEIKAGKDAYKEYGRKFITFLGKFGGRLEYGGKIKSNIVDVTQAFDFDAYTFVKYPSFEKMFEMLFGENWQEASKHRTAALEDSTVLKVKPYEEFLQNS
jgi:uncharacterized protein (DUF1330 family)